MRKSSILLVSRVWWCLPAESQLTSLCLAKLMLEKLLSADSVPSIARNVFALYFLASIFGWFAVDIIDCLHKRTRAELPSSCCSAVRLGRQDGSRLIAKRIIIFIMVARSPAKELIPIQRQKMRISIIGLPKNTHRPHYHLSLYIRLYFSATVSM